MKTFGRLVSALIYCVLLTSTTAQAQQPQTSPFDGMSAIDIMVAAAANKAGSASQSDVPAGTEAPTAGSSVSFHRFDLVELTGRFQHEGWYPIPGDPLPGTATGLAEMVGDWQSIQFRLVSENDEFIQEIELEPMGGGSFVGEFEVPEQTFKVAGSGIDGEGGSFDMTWPVVFRPQLLELRFESPFGIVEPGPVLLPFVVTNHGSADTFQLSATDDMGLGVSMTDTELVLAQGETDSTSVEIIVPAVSIGLLDITVTATATGSNNPERTNSASTVVRTQRFNLLLNSGFEAPQAGE